MVAHWPSLSNWKVPCFVCSSGIGHASMLGQSLLPILWRSHRQPAQDQTLWPALRRRYHDSVARPVDQADGLLDAGISLDLESVRD